MNDANNGAANGDCSKAAALDVTLLVGHNNNHNMSPEHHHNQNAANNENDMDQSMQMLDVSRIEVIRSDDPRFGPKHPSLRS